MAKKGKHDIAPKIRAGFIRAASRKGNGDAVQAIANQIERLWDDNFLGVLQAVGKFTVRENTISGKVEHDHRHTAVQDTADWIAELTAGGEDSPSEESLPH